MLQCSSCFQLFTKQRTREAGISLRTVLLQSPSQHRRANEAMTRRRPGHWSLESVVHWVAAAEAGTAKPSWRTALACSRLATCSLTPWTPPSNEGVSYEKTGNPCTLCSLSACRRLVFLLVSSQHWRETGNCRQTRLWVPLGRGHTRSSSSKLNSFNSAKVTIFRWGDVDCRTNILTVLTAADISTGRQFSAVQCSKGRRCHRIGCPLIIDHKYNRKQCVFSVV